MSKATNTPNSHMITDETGETIVNPVTAAPSIGTPGVPVYNVGSASVTPTEDSADGTVNASAPTVAIQIGARDGSNNLQALQIDVSGNLKVAGGGGGTQYVSGTTQVTPTGTVALGQNSSNVVAPLKVDGSGNLNINIAAGSVTATNPSVSTTGTAVPASATMIGGSNGTNLIALKVSTAGIPSVAIDQTTPGTTNAVEVSDGTNIIGTAAHPVQVSLANTAANATPVVVAGASGALALDASVTGLQVAQASTTSGQKGALALGAVTTAAPTYTTAQSDPLSLDTSGLLRVSLKDTPANTNKFLVTADPVTFASPQHVIADSGTITTISAVTAITNALPAGANVIGHVIADSGSTTAVTGSVTVVGAAASGATKSGNPVQIGGVFNTTQPTVTTGQAVEAQATARGAQIVASGVDALTVQPGNTANTTPWLVQDTPATSGGLGLPFSASLTSTKQQVKGSAGQLYGITALNNGSVICYIQVFDKTSANVTVGTTAPDYVFPVPAPASGTNGAGLVFWVDKGYTHANGITVACTTTRTGSTTATADVIVSFK